MDVVVSVDSRQLDPESRIQKSGSATVQDASITRSDENYGTAHNRWPSSKEQVRDSSTSPAPRTKQERHSGGPVNDSSTPDQEIGIDS